MIRKNILRLIIGCLTLIWVAFFCMPAHEAARAGILHAASLICCTPSNHRLYSYADDNAGQTFPYLQNEIMFTAWKACPVPFFVLRAEQGGTLLANSGVTKIYHYSISNVSATGVYQAKDFAFSMQGRQRVPGRSLYHNNIFVDLFNMAEDPSIYAEAKASLYQPIALPVQKSPPERT